MTVRMWSNFTDPAAFLPRDNLPMGALMTEPGSKNFMLKKNQLQ